MAVTIKYFCVKSKKYFNRSHLKTNTALRISFHAHYIFTKIFIFIYNNAPIHPNVTVQYLKSIPFVQKACKTCVHTSVSGKNQSSSQTKGFMLGLVQKSLDTCERVANIFLHPGANYTYMYRSFVTYRTRFSQVFSYIIQLRQKDSRQKCVTL